MLKYRSPCTVSDYRTQLITECFLELMRQIYLLPTPTLSVGVGRIFESVCLSVCPQHNSERNDPKVFKLGVGNDLVIY